MLVKVKATDFTFIYELYMNPKVNPYLLYETMNSENFIPIFNDLLKDEVLYLYEEDSEVIGMCKLIRQKHRNNHIVYLGGVAIHPDYFGKGFGTKMMLEIIDFCKTKSISRIELSVDTKNEKAIRLYESVGFEKEGILRNYTFLKSKNKYIDEQIMSNLI
jgi:RimJ/RimL family protein N-acetyltransferase